jgi:spore coat protein E
MEEVERMSIVDKDLECKLSQVTHTVTPPHNPTNILGAWIINHQYEAVKSGDGIEILGTYDINIWYSCDKNSKTDVAKETVSYVEVVPLSYLDPNYRKNTEEVSAESTQEPNCVEAAVTSDGSVLVRVEREYQVEMIAETKVCVVVCPGGCDDFNGKDYDFGIHEDGEDGDYEDLDPDLLDDDLD